MKSKELAQVFGYSERYIQSLTKKAIKENRSYIILNGEKIAFWEVKGNVGRGGKSYEYEIVKEKAVSRVRKSAINPNELPNIDFTKKSFSVDEKLFLVKFIKKESVSISSVAKTYSVLYGVNEKSVYKLIYRWVKAFEEGGKEALRDKRGGRESRIDEELFIASLYKNGNLKSYYFRYAFLEAKRDGREFNPLDPRASITFDAFRKYYNKMKKLPHIKAVLNGQDALSELEPKFSVKVDYPNQMWEIDATKLDLFVKIPVIDGEVNYFQKVESYEYVLKRYSLIGVIDKFSGARVYTLNKSDTSYSDVRLLEKAIKTLGKPEIIKGDNGKNYVSNHFQEVLEELGITYIAAEPYKGSEKGSVERGFRTLQHNYLFENLPGFIGHNTAERSKIENQAAGKSLKAKNGAGTQTNLKEKFLWWWEAERVIDGLINHMFSKNLEKHISLIDGFKEIPYLHILLGKKHKRKVQREGIYFNKNYYISKDLWMEFDIGDEVVVYEEIDDINTIYIKSKDGFIELKNREEFSLSVEEAKEIKTAYKKKIKKVKEAIYQGKNSALSDSVVRSLEKLSTLKKEQVKKIVTSKKVNNEDEGREALIELANLAGY